MSSNGSTPEQLEADIARQREALAETVDALHDRLDVKSRARGKVDELKARATTADGSPRPDVLAGAALAAVLVALVVWRRRR
ncbi:DUF3618 domain-containing protein [Nocardioides lijunqiniae]|uniref:DUF3618 domain-containing protein n=1 Tax=Nocardioides lijunqiniae TaxID=2760832 RepID=UPI001878CD1F|nr:DUF3618 domain-containing protein [Nocardioides lijunqiniae]